MKSIIKHSNKRSVNKKKVSFNIGNINNIKISTDTYLHYKPGEKVVFDLKFMPTSLQGNNYLCTFTDIGTRLSTTAYIKKKDTAKYKYIEYCKHIKNKTGKYPKYIHTDGGGEFINKELQEFNAKKGITHTLIHCTSLLTTKPSS